MNTKVQSLNSFTLYPKLDSHFDTRNGLSHNGVTSLLRDRTGYLWIATYDGLCRYNENNMVTFKNSTKEELFNSNRIRSLFEDSRGNIWIGTDQGISRYCENNKKFYTTSKYFSQLKSDDCIIHSFIESVDHKLIYCFTETQGVLVYDIKGQLLYYDLYPQECNVSKAIRLNNNIILFISNKGIMLYNTHIRCFEKILDENAKINDLILLDNNNLLIAYEKGLRIASFESDGNDFTFQYKSHLLYPETHFLTLACDKKGALWLGSAFQGVAYFDHYNQVGKQALHYISPKCRVSSILLLDSHRKWIATFDKGIYRFNTYNEIFKSFYPTDKTLNLKLSNIEIVENDICMVTSLFDKNRFFEAKQGREINNPYEERLRASIETNDSNSTIVLTQKDELLIFTGEKHITIKHPLLSKLPQLELVKAIKDSDGYIWMAYVNDLFRIMIDDKNNVLAVESIYEHPYFRNNRIKRIRALYFDESTHTIYFGTETQGLFCLKNLQKNASVESIIVKNFIHDKKDSTSLSSNFVSSFLRYPNGHLYIGTEQGGLCVMNELPNGQVSFSHYTEADGLSNNVVKNLVCDKKGNLWIGTNVGLNCFDVKHKHFHVYRIADGLPFEEFWYSACCLSDGTLVFSGVDGILFFNPVLLPLYEKKPHIEITNLKINDRIINTHNINDTIQKQITLNYNENFISVHFDVLYEDIATNHYIRYQLFPLNENWIELPATVGMITFNGLAPGKYELRIKASDSFANWTNNETISFIINPPIWRTGWAYLLYVFISFLLIYIIFNFILRLNGLRHSLQIEVMNKQHLEMVNQEKQRFFSNIAHELKTPLSLINAPVEMLSEKLKSDIDANKKLYIIKRQSKKILQLIDFAHSLELNEMNMLKLKKKAFDFSKLIDDISFDFINISKYENKSFEIQHCSAAIIVDADYSFIETICNNLLNNAFKFTYEKGVIILRYWVESKSLVLQVEDNGIGISEEELPFIFERYYQARKNRNNIGGTGIGLTYTKQLIEMHKGSIQVESVLNEKTVFTVILPIVISSKEEILLSEKKSLDDSNPDILEDAFDIEKIISEKRIVGSLVYVVEDNAIMREFLSDILQTNFKVETFSNGKDCINAVYNTWPDIIVSDVMMLEMDGFELCTKIKSDIVTSHIPVILLTACNSIDEQIHGLDMGADAYIPKPFYVRFLLKRIESLLASRLALQERYQIGIPLSMGENGYNAVKDNEFLDKLFALFSQSIDKEEADVDFIAKSLAVSRSNLFKKVKALTNSTPGLLFRNYKLKYAADILSSQDVNINEVCLMTGFKSRVTFSRLFKEKFGVTPSKYASQRNRHEQNY